MNADAPKLAAGAPPCPEDLTDAEARAEWGRITAELEVLGVLADIERAVIENYCRLWSQAKAADEEIAQRGILIEAEGYQGQVKIMKNPAVAVSQAARQAIRLHLIEFGLTPASRGKVSVIDKPEPNGAKALVQK